MTAFAEKGSLIGDPPMIKVKDGRKIDSASNMPITYKNRKDVTVDPDYAKRIILEAKNQGVDPYTALAIAHQETNLTEDDNPFRIYGGTKTDDPIKEGISFLKSKLEYAKKFGKKTESEQIQAYNGYGKITAKSEDNSKMYYGIDVSKNPINMNKNPLYGKRVIDLRDNVLKKNPDVVKLVNETNQAPTADSTNQLSPFNKPPDSLGLFNSSVLGLKQMQ